MACSRSFSALGLGLEKSVAEQVCGGEAVGVPFFVCSCQSSRKRNRGCRGSWRHGGRDKLGVLEVEERKRTLQCGKLVNEKTAVDERDDAGRQKRFQKHVSSRQN